MPPQPPAPILYSAVPVGAPAQLTDGLAVERAGSFRYLTLSDISTLIGSGGMQQFATPAAFPATGDPAVVYYAQSSNKFYVWSGSGYIAVAGGGLLQYPNTAGFPPVGAADTVYLAQDTNKFYTWNGSAYVPAAGGGLVQAANLAAFPATGAVDALYLAQDTNILYSWNGSAYVPVLVPAFQLIPLTGAQDGTNWSFTSATDVSGVVTFVKYNNQLLTKDDDYTLVGTTLTLDPEQPAPTASDRLRLYAGTLAAGGGGGGGGGATNLGFAAGPTSGTITNSNGTPAIIPAVTPTEAGFATPAMLAAVQSITIADNQVAVGTGTGIEGTAGLTFDGTTFAVTGAVRQQVISAPFIGTNAQGDLIAVAAPTGVTFRRNEQAGPSPTMTLTNSPILASLSVYRNGILQDDGVDYTVSGTTITFASPLVASELATATYAF